MRTIGLLSDTHDHIPQKMLDFFNPCDELWHAGDIGSIELLDKLKQFKPIRAVFGNIDDQTVRLVCKRAEVFYCEEVKVFMIHIGGYPGRYNPHALEVIRSEKPDLFIAGHSHILKIIYDRKHSLLHINPGAAGKYGLHQLITAVRFNIHGKKISDLEIFEVKKNM